MTKLIWLSLIFLCSCAVPKKGLVGEYLFDGNANDNTNHANHGIVKGATLAKGHRGKALSAYYFNGVDQLISIPHSKQIDFDKNENFTLSFWVSVGSTQNNMDVSINDIIRKWRGDTQGYPFAIVYYNNSAPDSTRNTFSFLRYDGSICRHNPSIISKKYPVERYSHLVCIKEGPLMKLYIDNNLVGEVKDSTEPASSCGSHNNADITIGTRGNRVRFFTGSVDDFRIYNRALSRKEVRNLYKN